MYPLYGALLGLAWSAFLPYQFVIAAARRRPLPRLGERLGRAPRGAQVRPGGLWVHAASVGEVRLALPLIAALRAAFGPPAVHLTTQTETGRALAERARDAGGEARPDTVSSLPIDLPGPMRRLLGRLAPSAVIILETEIWPHLLRACARRPAPVVFVNGRISPRAFARYRLVRPLLRRAMADVRGFAMQSDEDARRILDLGAPPDRVSVTGNMKFDLPPPAITGPVARDRLGLAAGQPLFAAGSTAPGEAGPVIEAFRAVRARHPTARLALAPRHPEAVAAADRDLRAAGLRVVRFGGPASERLTPHDALLVDVVGVLPEVYAAADVVFVGGSLVPRGGHNVLEPAALGKPVLFGPHMDNFRGPAQALASAGGGFVARDGRALGEGAARLLADPAARARAAAAARRVVEANRGALDRTVDLLRRMIRGGPAPLPRAAAPA